MIKTNLHDIIMNFHFIIFLNVKLHGIKKQQKTEKSTSDPRPP